MRHIISVQQAATEPIPISNKTLISWAKLPLLEKQLSAELCIRLVDEQEIQALNKQYRAKDKPTNVLAFPAQLPTHIKLATPYLGDLVICPAVLKKESEEFQTPIRAHWAHILLHGVLHLIGYDHIKNEDKKIMQALEIALLQKLNFNNPYDERSEA